MVTNSLGNATDAYEKAQQTLIGHVLTFPSEADEVFSSFLENDAEAFSEPLLRRIIEGMRSLHRRGVELSVERVKAEVQNTGDGRGVSVACLACMDVAEEERVAQELGKTTEDYLRAIREGYGLQRLKATVKRSNDYRAGMQAVQDARTWDTEILGRNGDQFAAVADRIYALRQKKGNQDRRKDFEINREVTSTILAHLESVGRFYTDGRAAYFFFETDKHLIEISPEDEGFRLLLYRYGINPTESIYRWIAEELRNVALSKGERAEIHRLSHYDPRRFTVYFYCGKNRLYRISCDRIDLVDNGTNGVLFVSDPRCKAFERVPVSDGPSRFTEIMTSKINFADDVLTAGERQRIFELWFYSTFFESIMPTKPIVAFIGPKGSGKSITLRKIGLLLFGEGFDVTPLSNDSKDFDAAVTNSPFVAFDNADHKCPWLNDRLATVATGSAIKKRELYTTNRLVEIPCRCFVGITAHTPHFRRDDVADRLLIMKVERFHPFLAEKTLLAEVVARRDEILSEVIEKLQRIVRALRAEQGVDDSSAFRMADFADFAVKVARHEGWGEQLKRIFGKLSHEQSEFTLEGDPIYETLSVWAAENPEQEVTYKELWADLKEVAGREGVDFHEYETNARAFVRRIPNIRSNLEEFFEITDIARGSRKVYHTFRLRESE